MEKRNYLVCIASLVGLGMGMTGCSNQRIDGLEQINQTQAARIEQLNQQVSTLESTVSRKQARIDELEGEVTGLDSVRGSLQSELGDIKARQSSLQDALGNLQLVTLDPETDRALRNLAAQHPDIIRYDSSRGMIMFTSDLTFGSGSDEVKPAARNGLSQLGQIMTQAQASTYDLRIVGHTDSQRMSNPATLRRFGSNRHLSFFRAAAVAKILRESGMPGERLETVGWGEFRPIMANNTRGGTPANRRVEIFVVPTSASSGAVMEAEAPVETTSDRLPMK